MMKKVLTFWMCALLGAVGLLTSCGKGSADSEAAAVDSVSSKPTMVFKVHKGSLNQAVKTDMPFDTVTLTYDIAWPEQGQPEAVAALRKWIVANISNNEIAYQDGTELKDVLTSLLKALAAKAPEGAIDEEITVQAEKDTPFEGYGTIQLFTDTRTYMARYSDDHRISATLRFADGQILDTSNAVTDKKKMISLITKYLEIEGKKQDPNWRWSNNITSAKNGFDLPRTPVLLTKEGVKVYYGLGEISSAAAGDFWCTIPYEEAIPALSDEVKAFLPETIVAEAEKKAQELQAAQDEAIKFLYQTYYTGKDNVSVGRFGWGYSSAIKNKFKELGITAPVDYPADEKLKAGNSLYQNYYSPSLNADLQKASKVLERSDDFELMLAFYGAGAEGEEEPFTLTIRDIKEVSPERVVVNIEEVLANPQDVVLVKIDGKWYIDDIYGYRDSMALIK